MQGLTLKLTRNSFLVQLNPTILWAILFANRVAMQRCSSFLLDGSKYIVSALRAANTNAYSGPDSMGPHGNTFRQLSPHMSAQHSARILVLVWPQRIREPPEISRGDAAFCLCFAHW